MRIFFISNLRLWRFREPDIDLVQSVICIIIVVVSFLCCDKLDLGIGSPGSHAAVPDLVLEEKREGFPERLLERGPHEAVNDGVDRGVGVRHAVGPRFDFVRGVVGLVVWVEGLEEGEDLDGTPADGEEEDDHNHHLGHFAPDADGPLRQEVDLRKRGSEYRDFSCIPGAHCIICFLFMIIRPQSKIVPCFGWFAPQELDL